MPTRSGDLTRGAWRMAHGAAMSYFFPLTMTDTLWQGADEGATQRRNGYNALKKEEKIK